MKLLINIEISGGKPRDGIEYGKFVLTPKFGVLRQNGDYYEVRIY